ncbi:MAG: lipopolysaccharide assembly protein LapA domain-containing protein [Xenococcaceae cyanobacterium]
MNTFTNFLTSLIISAWIGVIAVFSIQNITPISLKFLIFESIKLPVGVLLAFSVGVGMVVGAIAPLFWQVPKPRKQNRKRPLEDDLEYIEEEDPIEDWEESRSQNW